jgi:branched-chain amino acid aminotransferase
MKELNIWMNGKLVPPAQAVLPVNSAAVFYATNVFEGLRAYWNSADDEVYSFRLPEHFQRFRESMKMMRFTIPYSDLDLYEAVRQVLSGNEIKEDIHMHMCAYVTGTGLNATTPTGIYINPRRRPRVEEGGGLKCCVSSWARTSDNAIPIRLKCGANYQNGRLATLQANADGYDQPILLNKEGPRRRGHRRDLLHGAQGPSRDTAGHRGHPREHHADDVDGLDLPRAPRHGRGRA